MAMLGDSNHRVGPSWTILKPPGAAEAHMVQGSLVDWTSKSLKNKREPGSFWIDNFETESVGRLFDPCSMAT